jgi:hypothetical protein
MNTSGGPEGEIWPASATLLNEIPASTQAIQGQPSLTTQFPLHQMETRGRPHGRKWPRLGPLLDRQPADIQIVKEQSYAPTLSAEETKHIAKCTHHFGKMPPHLWEHTAWLHRVGRKRCRSLRARCAAKLRCGHRCGRPFFRTDMRDQQWFCSGHNQLLAGRKCTLLELPGEIRNEIYKYAFRPFLGLISWHEESDMKLLRVNKQVHKEVRSLMYGTKPLRLRYDEDDLSFDPHSFDWNGEFYHPPGRRWNDQALLRLLGRETFEHVNDIEISLDIQDLEYARRSILLDFVDALRTKRRTQLRRLTMKIRLSPGRTSMFEEEVVWVSRFLEAFREAPEFKDICFELEHSHRYGSKDKDPVIQRAYEIRDSLLPAQLMQI